jgi:cytochrome c oxidase assembly factor CtaG
MSFSWSHPLLSLTPVVIALALLAWYFEAIRHCDPPASRRQKTAFCCGTIALVIAASWPLAELAQTTSLLALVFQRQLLILVVAPLFLFAIPAEVGARLTRPRAIDWIVVRLSEPFPAIALTTALMTLTAVPFSVSAASRHSWIRGLVELGTLAAGFVLWNPVIRRVPGVRVLTSAGLAGYLFGQSIAMSFLSFAWILAPHLLYPTLHGQRVALGISPLLDQRLSGWLAKMGTFGVLWPVAFRCFSRGVDGEVPEVTPLEWRDVERQLVRLERQERRAKDKFPDISQR